MNRLQIKSIVTKKFKPASSNKKDDGKIYHNLLKQVFKASMSEKEVQLKMGLLTSEQAFKQKQVKKR